MDDTNDIFGNPIPGQLLVPSGRPPDFVAVTMGGSEKIHGAGAGAGQGSGVVLEQMDMDTKVVAFGRSRQQSDATVRNGSDPSDLIPGAGGMEKDIVERNVLRDVGEAEKDVDMVRHPEENQPNSSTRVAATRKVIHVPSVLQSDNDVAVRVVEDGSSREFLENNGRPLYGPIRSMYVKGIKRHSVVPKILPRKDSR
ncbi:hypothetical protein V6N13_020185 [Hibiscus sabdariffa]